jgi:hypothetical protein
MTYRNPRLHPHRIEELPGVFSRAVSCVYSDSWRNPSIRSAIQQFACDPGSTGSMTCIEIYVVEEYS